MSILNASSKQSLIAWTSYLTLCQKSWEQYGHAKTKSAATLLAVIPCPDVVLCSCCVILIDSLGNLSLCRSGPSSALELWVSKWWQRLTRCVWVCGNVESRRLYKGQQSLLPGPGGTHTLPVSFYLNIITYIFWNMKTPETY